MTDQTTSLILQLYADLLEVEIDKLHDVLANENISYNGFDRVKVREYIGPEPLPYSPIKALQETLKPSNYHDMPGEFEVLLGLRIVVDKLRSGGAVLLSDDESEDKS